MNKYLRIFGVATLVTSLHFSTASGVLATPAPKTENLETLGTAASNDEVSAGLYAEAHAAERTESGNLVSVTWSIKNESSEPAIFLWPSGKSYTYSSPTDYAGVTATTSDGSTRFHPIMDEDAECLCSGKTSLDFKERIRPGEKVAYWSMFSVPDDVDSIDLEIPGFDPIEDIPIS